MSERAISYLVYLPDGKAVVRNTTEAVGQWAVANIRQNGKGWVVQSIYDSRDAPQKRGGYVVTAERISAFTRGMPRALSSV